MKINKGFLAVAALLSASSAWAVGGVQLGVPSYGGTGCPAGTVSASLSGDATALSLIFDQYVAEAGKSAGNKSTDRKNCQLSIPVHLPQGWTVAVYRLDFRGFNSLPKGGSSRLTSEYFMNYGGTATGPSIRYQKDFVGPLQSDYLFNNTIGSSSVVYAPCGQDVILRTNTTMLVNTNVKKEQAMSTVDSIDIKSGIIYRLQWMACH